MNTSKHAMSLSSHNVTNWRTPVVRLRRPLAKGFLAALAVIALMAGGVGQSVALATLGDGSAPPVCVLACNPYTRSCSRFAKNEVPRAYIKVKYVPPRYKRVRSKSRCETTMCSFSSVGCLPPP
jgi:hypothetical protein